MSFEPLEYLRHMLVEIGYLLESSSGVDRDRFLRDETLRRAYARSLEVIGEAVKRVPEGYRKRYPRVEWQSIAGMRDRLIHGYFGVDYDLVWDVVRNKLPGLKDQLEKIVRELQ